jgi:hypothetical protein
LSSPRSASLLKDMGVGLDAAGILLTDRLVM